MGKAKDLFKEKTSPIGAFRKDLFEVEAEDTVDQNIVKEGIDYDKFVNTVFDNKDNKKAEDKKQETKKLDMFGEVKPKRNMSGILPGVSVSKPKLNKEHSYIGYLQDELLDIEEIPNNIILAHVLNVDLNKDNFIVLYLEGNKEVFLELVGFSSKFEAIFRITPAEKLVTGGSSRIYQCNSDMYLSCNVYCFDKNEPVVITINDNIYEFRFKELNTLNKEIKNLDVFNIVVNRVLRL